MRGLVTGRTLDRELSWICFNQRVLGEAEDAQNPLLERIRFLAITDSNLDEFCMVRIERAHRATLPQDGASRDAERARFANIATATANFAEAQQRLWGQHLEAELAVEGIRRVLPSEWSAADRAFLTERFQEEMLPLLTPVALTADTFTWPRIPNLQLAFLVALHPVASDEQQPLLASVVVPSSLARFLRLSGREGAYAMLEDVLQEHLPFLFEGYRVSESLLYRLTRGADLTVDEERDEDFIEAMEELLSGRKDGAVIRLELDGRHDSTLRQTLLDWHRPPPELVFSRNVPLGLRAFFGLASWEGRDDLRFPGWTPQPVPALSPAEDIWATLRERDVLLHHPYQSFDPVLRLVAEAAEDPRVLAIKQTLYRTTEGSPMVRALARAADMGKQVTALVELKARFDEANNIHWARALERAGVQVIYGVARLKTHCKALLIIRREPDGIRRYVHLGTGNYNEKTARLYTDFGLLSADDILARDVSALFNTLTGYSRPAGWRKLMVAPIDLKPRMLSLIQREAETVSPDSPGLIMAKMNSLVDRDIIKALYQASRAGVHVWLNIRGICCLRPGMKGLSENIRVVSIVGRFLEHSRLVYFRNGGREQIYLGSADWMPRNLERRVEIMFPVEDPAHRHRLVEILHIFFRDNQRAHELSSNGVYRRLDPGQAPSVDSQQWLMQDSMRRVEALEEQRRREFKPRLSDPDRL